MSVHKKLMEARIKLQNTQLKKSGHNKFAGYTYFELGDFLPTVQQIFSEIGLCGTVSFFPSVLTHEGVINQSGGVVLKIVDVDNPESFIDFHSPLASAQLKGCHEVQNLGASMTYIRRYLWVNALEIVEHDALDATTGSEKKGHQHKPTDNDLYQPEGEELVFIQGVLDTVNSKDSPAEAADYLNSQILDADQKVWIWDKLDSKTRSGIKKHNESLKQKESK